MLKISQGYFILHGYIEVFGSYVEVVNTKWFPKDEPRLLTVPTHFLRGSSQVNLRVGITPIETRVGQAAPEVVTVVCDWSPSFPQDLSFQST
jgi:hypothetical protein